MIGNQVASLAMSRIGLLVVDFIGAVPIAVTTPAMVNKPTVQE